MAHSGPAGTTYKNMTKAGEALMLTNAAKYVSGERSALLPPVLLTENPEPVDAAGNIIPGPSIHATDKQYIGLNANQSGEATEKVFYRAFSKLACEEHTHTMLLMRSYKINPVKCNALANEFPHVTNDVNTLRHKTGEADFVILVRNIGAVFVEVKKTNTADALTKAIEQIDRMKYFTKAVYKASIHGPLRSAKVVVCPDCPDSSVHTNGVHYFYKDSFADFKASWENVVLDLQQRASLNKPVTDADFNLFSNTMAGLWSVHTYKGAIGYQSNTNLLIKNIKQIDGRIEKQDIVSNKNKVLLFITVCEKFRLFFFLNFIIFLLGSAIDNEGDPPFAKIPQSVS